MYTLDETQIDSAESFINSLPDSIVKGNYERWLEQVNEDGRITSEQLEKFVSYANSLPKEFQNFPQNFAQSVKNGVAPENQSEGTGEPTKKKAGRKSAAKNKPASTPQKSGSQAKEEEDIIKRNKQVDDKDKVEKQKPTTVIVQKHK